MGFDELLKRIGLAVHSEQGVRLFDVLLSFAWALAISLVLILIFRKVIFRVVKHFSEKSNTKWDDILFSKSMFNRVSYLIPIIVFKVTLFSITWEYETEFDKIINSATVLIFSVILTTFLDSVNEIYETYEVSKSRPIKIVIQASKIVIYSIVAIIIISIVINKEPDKIFLGLGTFAAVVVLIFKDSILGFIAGIQLITNKMVKIGDWITLPDGSADGEVTDISLHTVKVQNWDKTISTIPAYNLVSQPFTNWKGMEESNGRRIKRSIFIDMDSVHFLTDSEIEKFKKSSLLKPYIEGMVSMLDGYRDNTDILDAQRLTNLGLFRKYLTLWIENNKSINQDMTHMVRQLQPTPAGIPIEIYCFSAKQAWIEYESVQADLFDHVLSIVPFFGLRIYQYSSPVKI